jgi:hypothetical protein
VNYNNIFTRYIREFSNNNIEYKKRSNSECRRHFYIIFSYSLNIYDLVRAKNAKARQRKIKVYIYNIIMCVNECKIFID